MRAETKIVEINYKIVICGIICLTIIYIALLLTHNIDGTIGAMIVGVIGLAIGVVIPSPKVDNKTGVMRWSKKKKWI